MLRISAIQNGTLVEIPEDSWEERIFPSSIGGRFLAYSEPDEFHMGAVSWRLSLSDDNCDVTGLHPELGEVKKDGGVLLPASFQPWSADAGLFAIPTWSGHHFFYHISEKRIAKSSIEGVADALVWSPTEQRILAVVHRHVPNQSRVCFLSTPDGRSCQLKIESLPDERAHFWWLKDGMAFMTLYRETKQSPPVVEMFDSQSGTSIGRVSVDPNQIVPYESSKYKGISRVHFSLETSHSSWCVGYFLDTWHKCHFDSEMNRLSLAVYRPSGSPTVRREQTVLPVAESWCTLQFEF